SINLRIMGRPNVALLGDATVLTPFAALPLPSYWIAPLLFLLVAVAAKLAIDRFLASETGLAMRATGANPRLARALGISTGRFVLGGMALSNALVALAGALFAQSQGSADISMGVGVIVVGLAAVILGEALVPGSGIAMATFGCVLGSILYRVVVAVALNADL